MNALTIYSLETLWWGVSIGGKHYTGHIDWRDSKGEFHRHELERKLSLRQAKELDPDAGERYWKWGVKRVTNRFDTREQLERFAAKWVEDHAAKEGLTDWLLIENDSRNPNRPIAGNGYIVDRFPIMRKMAKMWDKTDNATRNALTKEQWNTISGGWKALLKP
jgi:hypothetical protein